MKRKKEQSALILLQTIVIIVAVIALCYGVLQKSEDKDTSFKSSQSVDKDKGNTPSYSTSSPIPTPQNITFDPNTADSATFVRVGLSPMQAHCILKYRSKGGQYHSVNDFSKLYFLTNEQWDHIRPLIRINRKYQYITPLPDTPYRAHRSQSCHDRAYYAQRNENPTVDGVIEQGNNSYAHDTTSTPISHRIQKLKKGETIELNSADTSELQRIPGIGTYYAKRINEYRKKLGGYVSIEQLNDEDLSCLPLGIETYLKLSDRNIQKLHINRLTIRQLNAHPYLNYRQAKQICDRVRLQGPFNAWDELLFLSEFTEKDKERLEPYVSFDK